MIFHVCFLIHPFFWQQVFSHSQVSALWAVLSCQVKDILRTGNDIMVAGYCMYGAATELVITFQGPNRRVGSPNHQRDVEKTKWWDVYRIPPTGAGLNQPMIG